MHDSPRNIKSGCFNKDLWNPRTGQVCIEAVKNLYIANNSKIRIRERLKKDEVFAKIRPVNYVHVAGVV